jgi:hypothetical protein
MKSRTIAIGVIHGCSAALDALLEAIGPRPDDIIVTLGDYINRGPDSRGVLDRLIDLIRRCRLVPLLGNHDQMLLRQWATRLVGLAPATLFSLLIGWYFPFHGRAEGIELDLYAPVETDFPPLPAFSPTQSAPGTRGRRARFGTGTRGGEEKKSGETPKTMSRERKAHDGRRKVRRDLEEMALPLQRGARALHRIRGILRADPFRDCRSLGRHWGGACRQFGWGLQVDQPSGFIRPMRWRRFARQPARLWPAVLDAEGLTSGWRIWPPWTRLRPARRR